MDPAVGPWADLGALEFLIPGVCFGVPESSVAIEGPWADPRDLVAAALTFTTSGQGFLRALRDLVPLTDLTVFFARLRQPRARDLSSRP